MAYTNISNDVYISAMPAGITENDRALKEDKIVNAAKLQDLTTGNATGNIPINNGTICTNLNAEKLAGNLASAFATAGHTHTAVTTSSNGFMLNTDKTKLDAIASGAEVNQNAFSNIVAGATTVAASSKLATFTVNAGTGIAVVGDATNKACTISLIQDGHTHAAGTTSAAGFISATDKTKLDGIAAGSEVNQFAFSNIVAGGITAVASSKQGTFTVNAGTGITVAGDATNKACTISITANGHTHADATTSASGFMSAASLTKLNGITAGAEVNQNAFSNILVGATTVAASSKQGTVELVAGTNISLIPDTTNSKVTIAVTGKVASAALADTATTATTCTGNAAIATNADKVDGYDATTFPTVSTVAVRDGSGDITSRLFRSEYTAGGSTTCAYILAQNAVGTTASGADNYARPVTLAILKTALGSMPANGGTSAACTGNAATATKLATARTIAGIAFDGSANIAIPYSGLTGLPTIPSDAAYDAGHVFAVNGYQKFSNGLIIQWGRIVSGQNTFPIAFPTAALRMTTGNRPNYVSASGASEVFSLAKTGFYCTDFGTGDSWKPAPDYIVIGY